MATRFQKRRDTAENWTAVNPVLAQGEEGLELDTGKEKVGNGTANWNSLPYKTFGITASSIGAATAAQGAKADTAVQPAGLTKAAVGLGNVDNTSDANKPISTATAAALAGKADTTSVALLSSATPQALGTATAGTATEASRADHRHAMPNATQVGADASGTAAAAVAAHAAAADPHPGYAQLRDRSTHTGTQSATTITGLSTVATSGAYGDLSGRPDLALKADLVNGLVPSSQLPGFVDAAPVQSVAGRTGNVTLAKSDVGLGNADNTSDADKPISTAATTALAGKVGTTDSRLSDPRTPTAHKASHATGGTDALTPADIGAATTAQGAKADSAVQPAGLTKAAVGLGNADNTSDDDKPVSTAAAAALAGKVDTTDSRLSDARTPTAHKSTHATGGTDALSPADIGAATAAQGAKADTAVQPAGLTKAAVGLGNADNTSDANKPVSTATATALEGKVGTVTTGITGAGQITNMVSISQANYDAIPTKNAQTLYVISG